MLQIIAKENKLDVELVETKIGEGAKSPEYKKINKTGQVPSFVGADGFILTECIAIAVYRTLQSFPFAPYRDEYLYQTFYSYPCQNISLLIYHI